MTLLRLEILLTVLCLSVMSCKTRDISLLRDRDTESQKSKELFERTDPYDINATPNYALDFAAVAASKWVGDDNSGLNGYFVRPLLQETYRFGFKTLEPPAAQRPRPLTRADFEEMEKIYCGFPFETPHPGPGKKMCVDWEESYALFFANAPINDEVNWVADQMFTKALDAAGRQIRVRPYVRTIPYNKLTLTDRGLDRQNTATYLKKVLKPGDILVFFHPELNDFGVVASFGPPSAQKEIVKFRSTHAGMAWYDGDKVWALNSPHDYAGGWFDRYYADVDKEGRRLTDLPPAYPFHIFRVVPNQNTDPSASRFANIIDDGGKGITMRDLYAEYQALYAGGMSMYFDFPGDFNGKDPINLFDTRLIVPTHQRWITNRTIPPIADIMPDFTFHPETRDGQDLDPFSYGLIYCAEFVWTSANLAWNKVMRDGVDPAAGKFAAYGDLPDPAGGGRTNLWKYFQAEQYQSLDGTSSQPDFQRMAAIAELLDYQSWSKEPRFIFEPHSIWDIVEAFILNYYGTHPPRVQSVILSKLKPSIFEAIGISEGVMPVAPIEQLQLLYEEAFVSTARYGEALKKATSGLPAAEQKTAGLNFIFDSIIYALIKIGEPLDQKRGLYEIPRKQKRNLAIVKRYADGLTATLNERGTRIPVAFIPPHAFLWEAQKLDSNIVYVATALPDRLFKRTESGDFLPRPTVLAHWSTPARPRLKVPVDANSMEEETPIPFNVLSARNQIQDTANKAASAGEVNNRRSGRFPVGFGLQRRP